MTEARSILMIANLLVPMKRGNSVSETIAPKLIANGWRVRMASGKIARLPRLYEMLVTCLKYCREYDCVFIEVFSGRAFVWAEIVCQLLKILKKPYVLGLFGGNLPDFARANPGRVGALFNSANKVIAPSGFLIDKLQPYTTAKITLLSYGVDLSQFSFRLRKNPEPKLIYMRGFHSIYAPWIPVEAVALLKNEFPKITLKMTGGNKFDGSLERMNRVITENSLHQEVNITGFLKKPYLEASIHAADLLLNTPVVDNTPVSVMQAMASGLCIVSTNVGGLPYLIDDGVDGLLVPPDDPKAVATAVRRILTEPGLAERLSFNARRKAEQLDWSVVLPQWQDLLQAACGFDGKTG